MSETITIEAKAEQYEDAIVEAMASLQKYIGTESCVHRQAENPEAREYTDWYVNDVVAVVSPGNQWVGVVVDFTLVGSDL